MTEIITTLNSTYEVDWAGSRVRRLVGVNEPTPNQSADGEWQQATHLQIMSVNPRDEILYMIWDHDRATLSSKITGRDSA